MDGVGAGDLAGRQDLGDVQVGIARRRRADAHALVGKAHVHGVGVGGRMHRDGGDAQFLARTQHPEGDLTAVGDQDLLEQVRRRRHSMIRSGSPNSTGWPSSTRILLTLPERRRRDLVHRLHRFDDEHRVALADLVADLDVGASAGLGRAEGGADHRRMHRAGVVGVRHKRCRRGCAAAIGAAGVAGVAGGDRRDREVARDADARALALDLDLGQHGLAQQVGELADEGLIDDRFLVSHQVLSAARRPPACRRRRARQAPPAPACSPGARDRKSRLSRPAKQKSDGGSARGRRCWRGAPRSPAGRSRGAHRGWRSTWAVGASIQHDAGRLLAGLLDPVDQHALAVVLAEIDAEAELLALAAHSFSMSASVPVP